MGLGFNFCYVGYLWLLIMWIGYYKKSKTFCVTVKFCITMEWNHCCVCPYVWTYLWVCAFMCTCVFVFLSKCRGQMPWMFIDISLYSSLEVSLNYSWHPQYKYSLGNYLWGPLFLPKCVSSARWKESSFNSYRTMLRLPYILFFSSKVFLPLKESYLKDRNIQHRIQWVLNLTNTVAL